jgi:hypothetical protein
MLFLPLMKSLEFSHHSKSLHCSNRSKLSRLAPGRDRHRCAASAAQRPPSATLDSTAYAGLFDSLAGAVASTCRVAAAETPLGRGTIAVSDLPVESDILALDWANLLCVSDAPDTEGTTFSRQVWQDWQSLYGPMPPLLVSTLMDGESGCQQGCLFIFRIALRHMKLSFCRKIPFE